MATKNLKNAKVKRPTKAASGKEKAVANKLAGLNTERLEKVAAANGLEKQFRAWKRNANPGTAAMSLGNVLRAKARHGEAVKGL